MALSDAQLIALLRTRRDAVATEISTISVTAAGGLPDAAVPNAIQHQAYKRGLYQELADINKQLAELEGGFSLVSEATT